MADYRRLSLWHDSLEEDLSPRPPLPGDRDADVVVVGAGLTGLWTAYYLGHADPSLRITVVEEEVAGFGASGRNGGWCSALFPRSRAALAAAAGRDQAIAMVRAMRATVDEVGAVLEREGVDAHFVKGGTLVAARSAAQWQRAQDHLEESRNWGDTADDLALLMAHELLEQVRVTRARGGTFTPHCAAVHPARLVRGLARVVEERGVTIYERTPALGIEPGKVTTPAGVLRGQVVVRATEGFTARLSGHERALAPVYSLMIATEPLPESTWQVIGLERRQTFADYRHLVIYGQRTADDRIAFGGRGAPYHFSSRVRPEFEQEERVFALLRQTLVDLFPVLREARVTHRWGGPLGVPRDWCASVGLDRETGLAWAGGYVGDGVTTTNLAGRTLTDLILRRESDLVALPWVDHRSPSWEREPWRWLGVNAGLRLMTLADGEERATGRPSVLARALSPLLGGR